MTMSGEMGRRRFLQVSAGAVGVLAVGACTTTKSTSKPSSGGSGGTGASGGGRQTLHLDSGQIINSYPAPFSYFQAPGYQDTILMFDTLLQAEATGQLLPWLATSYQASSDGLVHKMELRSGVRWHDGQPFTADDVVFTFDYIATKTLPRQRLLGLPDFPVHARAIGPQAIELSLEKPVVTFAQKVLASLPIVPQHIWSSIDDPGKVPADPKFVVGTGPYRLTSYNDAEGTSSYVANDDFFLGKPFIQRIEYKPVNDELSGLLTGDIDLGQTEPKGSRKSALAPFRNDSSFGILESKEGFFIPLKFSIAKGGALADVRFRQACAKAINRQDMVTRLIDGQGEVGNPGLLQKSHPYHVDVEQYPFDPAGANSMLDAAGYTRTGTGVRKDPAGQPLRFNLLSPTGSSASELVVSQLRAIGVELQPTSADPLTIINKGGAGDYEMAVAFGAGQSGDPDFLRETYSSKIADNFSGANGYVNPELDDLAERQLYTVDVPQRKDICAQIQRIVARDVPIVPLYYATAFTIYRKKGAYREYPDPVGVTVLNTFKHHYVTGEPNGLKIRQA